MTRLSTRRYLLRIFGASAVVACIVLSMSTAGVCQPGPQQSTAPTLPLPIQAGAAQAGNAATHAPGTPQRMPATPPGFSQSPATASPPLAAAPVASTPSPGAVRETKETQELKEITERPRDWFDIAIAFAWPLTVIGLFGILLLAIANSAPFREFSRLASSMVRKIEIPGLKLEVDPEVMSKLKTPVIESFDQLVEKAKPLYDSQVSAWSIEEHLSRTVRTTVPEVLRRHKLNENPAKLRATIHVPDIVAKDYFFQLVPYFPNSAAGGPAGRRLSQRYGIIGLAWRLERSIGFGRAVQSPNADTEYIQRWGMTADEARAARHLPPANLCIILRDPEQNDLRVGLLFIDSTEPDAFGTHADDVAEEIEAEQQTKALAKAVASVIRILRIGPPALDITGRRPSSGPT